MSGRVSPLTAPAPLPFRDLPLRAPWSYASLNFSTIWRLAGIFDLVQPEVAPFDPPSPKTLPQNET